MFTTPFLNCTDISNPVISVKIIGWKIYPSTWQSQNKCDNMGKSPAFYTDEHIENTKDWPRDVGGR